VLELKKPAVAGTLESSDIQISMAPNPGKGIEIELDSVVKMQFGDSILATVRRLLEEFEIAEARISLNDKGAIDAVIAARMQTVICRAAEIGYNWAKEDPHAR
jgi:citrate lyase subunit gamma (acyl carrier protein)